MIAWHARRYYYDFYNGKEPAEEPSNVFFANLLRSIAVVPVGNQKWEFVTMEGATNGARELKTRFPMLQIRIYDAAAKTRTEVTA